MMTVIRRLEFVVFVVVFVVLSGNVLASGERWMHVVKKSETDLSAATTTTVVGNRVRALESKSELSFLAGYSIKFQGCHRINQWNVDATEEEDVKVRSKRLARFRLLPSNTCHSWGNNNNNNERVKKYAQDAEDLFSNNYGDYIIDLNKFVFQYLTAQKEELSVICSTLKSTCTIVCNGVSDGSCMYQCYSKKGYPSCSDSGTDLNPLDYAYCAAFDNTAASNDGVQYYLGPYCAGQGGSIKMGIFTDDTCTTMASCGATCYQKATGLWIPGSQESIISNKCTSCADGGYPANDDVYAGIDDDLNSDASPRSVCTTLYGYSGKCETHLKVDYPSENACQYIEGIKIVQQDGSVSARAMQRSRGADITMGILMVFFVFVAMYIYYLSYKLGRTKLT